MELPSVRRALLVKMEVQGYVAPELTGFLSRRIDPSLRRHSPAYDYLRQRDEHIVAPGIKQRLLGQRAGRHVSHDVARHERLAPARLRLRRGFGLLGNGDAMARLDQPREIALRAMDRHPAHRDRRAIMLAPAGQRDVERGRRRFGIIEEEFEEIAHAVEEQAILCLGLERQILRHHGRKG